MSFLMLHAQWLEEEFLGFLDEWKQSVKSLTNVSDSEKNRMLLPHSTLTGLHMTGKLCCEKFVATNYIFCYSILLCGASKVPTGLTWTAIPLE